jgi:hypothetical protein
MMMKRAVLLSVLLLAACNRPAQPAANQTEPVNAANAAEPAPPPHLPDTAPLPAGGIAQWLVGTWSFEKECASDFVVTYEAGGKLDNSGETGTWKLDGDTVTETVTARLNDLGEQEKVDPSTSRSYTVARTDQNHGVLTYQGKKVPILRC